MKYKDRRKIEYIEVTERRYSNIKTQFKYVSLDSNHEKHYYLARNRMRLEDELLR